RDCREQWVLLHVPAGGLGGRQAVLVREFILGINDDRFHGAVLQCTLTYGFHILSDLTQIQRDCDNVTSGHLWQVRDGNRGIKAAGVSKHNACVHSFYLLCLNVLLIHDTAISTAVRHEGFYW